MESEIKKEKKTTYEIFPLYSNNGKSIDAVIEGAFLKYLKYNDYKQKKFLASALSFFIIIRYN